MNSNQDQNNTTDDNVAKTEKRAYQTPEIVEFTPSVWALSTTA
jgi:hypothetical protein